MGGENRLELQVYVEDRFAATIVEEALPLEIRPRLRVTDIGSATALARQAVSHRRMDADHSCLALFDGDCSDAEIRRWINSETGGRKEIEPDQLKLPGADLPPERWLLKELGTDDYLNELATQLGCTSGAARDHVDNMAAQVDHHSTAHVLALRSGISEADAAQRLARSVSRHPGMEAVRAKIAELLDG